MLFLLLALVAQQRPPDMPITPERRAAIVEGTAKKIEEEYVDPDKGKEIAAALRKASFPQVTALELVPAVNAVLQTAGDKHLRFGYDASLEAADSAEESLAAFGVRRLDGNIGDRKSGVEGKGVHLR